MSWLSLAAELLHLPNKPAGVGKQARFHAAPPGGLFPSSLSTGGTSVGKAAGGAGIVAVAVEGPDGTRNVGASTIVRVGPVAAGAPGAAGAAGAGGW